MESGQGHAGVTNRTHAGGLLSIEKQSRSFPLTTAWSTQCNGHKLLVTVTLNALLHLQHLTINAADAGADSRRYIRYCLLRAIYKLRALL